MKPVYLLIGCPGSGKTWICNQLHDDFHIVHHDLYIDMSGPRYVMEIIKASRNADKPILAEAPFSISQTKEPLEEAGIKVIPVFIQEHPDVITKRYVDREGKAIPKGHLTRQQTYKVRAHEYGAFQGTSEQVLKHLKEIKR